ncbi:MAG: hypothetical protein M5R41_13005 [Bacteroidia bacterium]|nr:hypothetical protein [Bacteroidia bacterium]
MKTNETTQIIPSQVIDKLYVDAPVAPAQPEVRERTRPVYTGLEDHSISIEEASALTRNYRMQAGAGAIKEDSSAARPSSRSRRKVLWAFATTTRKRTMIARC